MFQWIAYWTTHPQAIIEVVSTSLLYPVLFLEVAAMGWIVFESGRFTVEAFKRRRYARQMVVDTALELATCDARGGGLDKAYARMGEVNFPPPVRRVFVQLGQSLSGGDARIARLVAEVELGMTKRLDGTRMFIRFGPILGLMGTLIPISPALVALAQGDIQSLSTNLIIAFSTTVVGLLIGGLSFGVSTIRERWYASDLSDLEYVLERLGA